MGIFEVSKAVSAPFDWGLFLTTTLISTVLAALVTTLITRWIIARNRPEPDWSISGQLTADNSNADGIIRRFITGTLRNTGDGTGHAVQVLNGQKTEAWTDDFAPRAFVLAPGETLPFAGITLQDDFLEATVKIRWLASPTRLNRWYELELHLADFFGMDGHISDTPPMRRVQPTRARPQNSPQDQQPRSWDRVGLKPARPLQPPRWTPTPTQCKPEE